MAPISEDFATAIAHHQAGRLDEAERIYRRILALDSDSITILNNLGLIVGKEEAESLFRRALSLKPDYADAKQNLRNLLTSTAIAHHKAGRLEDAERAYRQSLALDPDNVAVLYSLGRITGKEEAETLFRRALVLKPDYTDAGMSLGATLQSLGRWDEAAVQYERVLAFKPDYVDAHMSLGIVFHVQERLDKAVEQYQRVLALNPDYAEAHLSLGKALQQLNRHGAVACYEQALHLRPDLVRAHFGMCMAQLSPIYSHESEIVARRAAYSQSLKALCERYRSQPGADWESAVESELPFFLAYQGYNDRDMQRLYGGIVYEIMARRQLPAVLATPPEAREQIRVGIVSAFFFHHSNWKIPMMGWISQLDRRKFRLFGYYTDNRQDDATQVAAGLFERFVQGALPLATWRDEILADAPHILIYPEVGMSLIVLRLAAQRLAPVQCTSWGHPITSGLPSLDYYLSSDLMEPPDASEHYTERLVRLPNLSIYYEPVALGCVELSRAEIGFKQDAIIYWSGQSLYKYLPQYDDVFPEIAMKVDNCQFGFIRFQKECGITEQFKERLGRSFQRFGLNADDYCVFLPRLEPSRFLAAQGLCDIVLDSIGWSGCNSTMESLQHDLPIVTMAGSLMRGRHTMAILQMMGVTETITTTLDSYVATAVRLGRDPAWRHEIKQKVGENKHRIYRDRDCIDCLERFIEDAVRSRGKDPRNDIYHDLHARQLASEEAANTYSAERILDIIFRYYRPDSVLDVGCGLGTWLKVIESQNIRDIRGIDGSWLAPASLRVAPACIETRDLEEEFDLGRRFDLVICLEVAEHLDEKVAEIFVNTLTRHAPVVLFSAAIPFQGGHHHINERFLPYWAELFARCGYEALDIIRPEIWEDPMVLLWLRQNTILFINNDIIEQNKSLARELRARKGRYPLSIVHPDIFLRVAQAAQAAGSR